MTHPPRCRVLAVDDDPGMLRVVTRILGQRYLVEAASGAQAALEAAVARQPDVAIVDIRLPEMNGFELMRQLRSAIPELDVILMTGNAEEPDANGTVRLASAGAAAGGVFGACVALGWPAAGTCWAMAKGMAMPRTSAPRPAYSIPRPATRRSMFH